MKNISVIGSGTMGNGIAHVFAQFGFKVSMVDISQQKLDSGMLTIGKNLDRQVKKESITAEEKIEILGRIDTNLRISEGVKDADIVIEAATENWDIKQELFKELDSQAPKDAILASNTSSISITKIAAVTSRPEKVIGMHFMNPVPIMPLIEVISGYRTSTLVLNEVIELGKSIGKDPVEVNDYPGFVANRILMPMINEAIISLQEGVASVKSIDAVMKLGMAHPMGPLQLADFIGLDVCLSILNVLYEGFGNPKYAPSPLLINMVQAGILGVKTGEGFYAYSKDSKEAVVSPRFKN
ncbi:3-hydroxyacyl-CoA dehydrogenase family protein [Lunatibacter salilacus]|uniref:3-hydroxyacyl-CoA dehydrogenase family protein n=1 Tax=Lunatibacter salilacus TaxID=2483804 RepID=UPI00131E34A9|nr:3-hydroxybutyryl-CoA dehydrogenase [Lunatibacter salilacus]